MKGWVSEGISDKDKKKRLEEQFKMSAPVLEQLQKKLEKDIKRLTNELLKITSADNDSASLPTLSYRSAVLSAEIRAKTDLISLIK